MHLSIVSWMSSNKDLWKVFDGRKEEITGMKYGLYLKAWAEYSSTDNSPMVWKLGWDRFGLKKKKFEGK